MKAANAEVIREYGPFPGITHVHGVSYDGSRVWFATGEQVQALDPESGQIVRSIDVQGDAGTAFDGRHLFQIAESRIQKIDPATSRVLATIPAPGGGSDSAWPGPRVRCGWGSTNSARFTRSIPRPGRCCARLIRTVSLPASPGWTESSGTVPGRKTRAICGA